MRKYIIPIFIPHYGCPHQCVFCNQKKITGIDTPVQPNEVKLIIERHLATGQPGDCVEVAFYGGSFTALPIDRQADLLKPAYAFLQSGRIAGIRLSTRPDCISTPIIEHLQCYGVTTVELGVQSLDDEVLAAAGRGHNAEVVSIAARQLKTAGMTLGIQLMPGLPAETRRSLLLTGIKTLLLKPEIARIYPTVVIADTQLAAMNKTGQYIPLTLAEAVWRSVYLKLLFLHNNIEVIRTGLQPTAEMSSPGTVLAGPYHPAFGEMVDSAIFMLMLQKALVLVDDRAKLTIHHHYRDTSKVRGGSNANIKAMRQARPDLMIQLEPDAPARDELILETGRCTYVINTMMLEEI